jgi:uncharacterized protein (DUF1015 family)
VPRFIPFRADRYSTRAGDLADLTAPPYDVLSPDEIEHYRGLHPTNIVWVDVPRESDGPDRYRNAAGLLRQWIQDETLRRDPEPSFTIYRMSFTDPAGVRRSIDGVLGGLEVVDEGAGGVLPHERTTPKASTDRLDLTRATRANLSPVWGLSLARGLSELLAQAGEPIGEFVSAGVEHRLERVDDPDRVRQISELIASDDVLIADGHHRYSISRTYRDEQRGLGAGDEHRTDAAEFTLAFINELVEDQLSVEAIHRLYQRLDTDALRARLEEAFEFSAARVSSGAIVSEMRERNALCFAEPNGALWWMTPRPGAFDGLRALDGAWLEHALIDSGAEVSYQHGVDEALAAVRSGEFAAGVLIRPVRIAEIERTAREGLLMPPKSTFFTPKLQTGLVIRSLE